MTHPCRFVQHLRNPMKPETHTHKPKITCRQTHIQRKPHTHKPSSHQPQSNLFQHYKFKKKEKKKKKRKSRKRKRKKEKPVAVQQVPHPQIQQSIPQITEPPSTILIHSFHQCTTLKLIPNQSPFFIVPSLLIFFSPLPFLLPFSSSSILGWVFLIWVNHHQLR